MIKNNSTQRSFFVHQADWCFGDGDVADLTASIPENCGQVPEIEQSAPNQNLLDNINKVSGNQYTPFMAKDLVTNIVAAANRKMHRATGKNSMTSRKSRSNISNSVISQTGIAHNAADAKQVRLFNYVLFYIIVTL